VFSDEIRTGVNGRATEDGDDVDGSTEVPTLPGPPVELPQPAASAATATARTTKPINRGGRTGSTMASYPWSLNGALRG
jgi:hypothetical protein